MHHAITFKSAKFDVSKEDENLINPIFGQSLLAWLKGQLGESIEITEPDTEDWGWYSELNWHGRDYLIGSSVFFEEGDNPTEELEWVFQVHKNRTLKEKLLGREKMTKQDDCLLFFKLLFEKDDDFNDIVVE